MSEIVSVECCPCVQPCTLRYDKIVLFRHDLDNVLKLRIVLQIKLNQDIAPVFPLLIFDLRSQWVSQRSFPLPKSAQTETPKNFVVSIFNCNGCLRSNCGE